MSQKSVSSYQHTLHGYPERRWMHFLSSREKQFVFPNFKPGIGCGLTISYRIISITTFVSKTLEWMVNGWLLWISSLIETKLSLHFISLSWRITISTFVLAVHSSICSYKKMEYSKGQYEVYIIYTFHTCHWRCEWSTSRTFLFVCWCCYCLLYVRWFKYTRTFATSGIKSNLMLDFSFSAPNPGVFTCEHDVHSHPIMHPQNYFPIGQTFGSCFWWQLHTSPQYPASFIWVIMGQR